MRGIFNAGKDLFKIATGGHDEATEIARETKGSEADVVRFCYFPGSLHRVVY
jgi:hypothetical protein